MYRCELLVTYIVQCTHTHTHTLQYILFTWKFLHYCACSIFFYWIWRDPIALYSCCIMFQLYWLHSYIVECNSCLTDCSRRDSTTSTCEVSRKPLRILEWQSGGNGNSIETRDVSADYRMEENVAKWRKMAVIQGTISVLHLAYILLLHMQRYSL